jgi:protein subunit release factor A
MKIPDAIMEGLKWGHHREAQKGGQQCGMPNYGVRLTHQELGFEISTDAFRSQINGKEFCMAVFELFLSEIKAI